MMHRVCRLMQKQSLVEVVNSSEALQNGGKHDNGGNANMRFGRAIYTRRGANFSSVGCSVMGSVAVHVCRGGRMVEERLQRHTTGVVANEGIRAHAGVEGVVGVAGTSAGESVVHSQRRSGSGCCRHLGRRKCSPFTTPFREWVRPWESKDWGRVDV